jgi:hypothetical protein
VIEWAQWAWAQVLLIMQDAQMRAIVAGMCVGMAATEAVAHMLPPAMEAWRADRLVRLVVLGVAMCSSFALMPTLHGFVWAFFAGLAAPTVYSFATRCVYARWPALEPKALKP